MALGGRDAIASTMLASPLLIEFGLGVLLARFHRAVTPADPRRRAILAAVLLACGTAAFLLTAFAADPMRWRVPLWAVPGALMVWGAMLVKVDPARREWRLPVFLGTASYSIYLAHPFATLFAGTVLKHGLLQRIDADVLLVAMTAITIAATAASYLLIERPLVMLLKPRRVKSS